MRAALSFIAAFLSASAIAIQALHPAAESRLCRFGLCRFDQIYASVDAEGMTIPTVRAVLRQDPGNPLVWGAYGDLLAPPDPEQAKSAWARAVSLGPSLAPVLLRAAQFHFEQGHSQQGLALARRLLAETRDEDQIVFPYLRNLPGGQSALPATRDAARSWVAFLIREGTVADLDQAWSWLKQTRLTDAESASALASELWRRKSFQAAQDLWVDWLGTRRGDYPHPQFLANRRFENPPAPVPFDWNLEGSSSVSIARSGGLDIRFLGLENIGFMGVRQSTVVRPGRYRFSAEIETEGLTTDQRPYFRLFDPTRSGLEIHTADFPADMPRSWITVDVDVPPGASAVQVQLERRHSLRYDGRIQGRLHIYQVSLVPLGR